MKLIRFAAPALALTLLASTGAAFAAPAMPLAPIGYFGQAPGWDVPPGEYREFQQRGFHDGIEGARRDFENHRPFTPENRDEYRHPSVPRNVYRDYRMAFREGYHRAVVNMGYGRPR